MVQYKCAMFYVFIVKKLIVVVTESMTKFVASFIFITIISNVFLV